MRSEWGFAGGCAALDLLLNSRRRGSTGLRGAWTCPAHFGAAVLLLLCAPAYAGDVSESNPGASGQAGGVKNFPTARDVALMEMFTQNGGSLNGVVYSLKEPGDDALLSHEPDRGLFAKESFSNGQQGKNEILSIPVNVTISMEAAKASPIFRILKPVFDHSEIWGLSLFASWTAIHNTDSAIALLLPDFPNQVSAEILLLRESELNNTFIESYLNVELENLKGFLEVARGFSRKYPHLFPAQKFTTDVMTGAYMVLQQRAVQCSDSRSGALSGSASSESPELKKSTAVIAPMLGLSAYNGKKTGHCKLVCEESVGNCSYVFSASLDRGEELSWDWGGLTDAQVFMKFGQVPAEPNPMNRISLGVPLSEDPGVQDAQRKLMDRCGNEEDFVLDADGVPSALLCATRVAITNSSDLLGLKDWDPKNPLSEANERDTLASLEETFEIILNSYPTSDAEDEDLLQKLKGREAAMVRMRLNEKLLLINAMNFLEHYNRFTLQKLKYARQGGESDKDDEL